MGSNDYSYIGREHYFRHYSYSQMPIRDITAKTEPHIEIGAENYLRCCYQPNIERFLKSQDKYLFLCTTCCNREINDGWAYGKRFIIGFIKKGISKDMGTHSAAMGDTYIVKFDESLEYGHLGIKRSRGMQRFNDIQTKRILETVCSLPNILIDCIDEMIRMEIKERNNGRVIPIDNECMGAMGICEYQSQCLRKKISI